jgi:chaperonin GroES
VTSLTKIVTLRPLGERILVEPLAEPETTEGGLIRPDVAKERPVVGKVVAVGLGIVAVPTVGDLVLFSKFGGTEVEVAGKRLLLLLIDEVLAIVNQ